MLIEKYLYEVKENEKYNIYKSIALIDSTNMQNNNEIKNNDFLAICTKNNQKIYRFFFENEDDKKILNMLSILFKDNKYLTNAKFLRKDDEDCVKETIF